MDKMRKSIFLFLVVIFMAVPVSAQELSNAQLLKEIRELKSMVKQQAIQIKELQMCYEKCGAQIAENSKALSDIIPTTDRDVSVRLRKQLERLESAAGLDIGVSVFVNNIEAKGTCHTHILCPCA